MIPENWETNEMNLWLPQLTTLRDFPGFSSGRENPCGAFRIPRVGEVELTLEGARERTREGKLDTERTSEYLQRETACVQGKSNPKRLEGRVLDTLRAKNNVSCCQEDCKPLNS